LQIALGRPEEPNVLYCGVEPAALFETRDAGETWSLIRGLFEHPHRPRWMPGNGGLALHTIVLDPSNDQRMYVAISAAAFTVRTMADEAGRAKPGRPRYVYADSIRIRTSVHKIAMHPGRPERPFPAESLGTLSLRQLCRKLTDMPMSCRRILVLP